MAQGTNVMKQAQVKPGDSQQTVIKVPVKPGETIWDTQARVEKRADADKTKTSTNYNLDGSKHIETEYSRNDGKPVGSVLVHDYGATVVEEYDNEGMKSGTKSFDDNNDGTVDRKYRFCWDS